MYDKLCKIGDEEAAIKIAEQKLKQCIREGKQSHQKCVLVLLYTNWLEK